MVPEGWDEYPVGEICNSIVPGRNKPKLFDGDIPWVTTPEISGKYIPSKLQKNYISKKTATECGAKIVPKGSVIMAAVGEIGLTAIATEKIILNQQLHAFVCLESVHNEYLAYYLSSQKPYMWTVASKTTIPYLNKSNCESIPILLPPLPEQRKITKILQTWDRAISTTEKLIDASKQQKKALMQQLLTGKKRFAGFEGERSKRAGFAQKKLGALPDDWVLVNVAERYWFQEGPGVRKHQFTESGIKLLNGTNIQKSRINLGNTNTHIAESEGNGSYAHFLADAGDLVIACSGISVDRFDEKIAFLDKSHLPICMNTSTMRFKVKSEESETADIEYLRYFLMSTAFKNQIRRQITGSAQLNFGPSHVERCFIPMPTMLEQRKIAKALNSIDNELDRSEERLRFLKQEKKALMQQLLTGKRRVRVDD